MTLMPITPNIRSSTYRLDLASADGVTFDLAAGAPVNVPTITFRSSGSTFYGVENDFSTGAAIYRYSAQPDYQINSSFLAGTQSMLNGGSPETIARLKHLEFSKDGTQAFVLYSSAGDNIATYAVSPAFTGTASRTRTNAMSDDFINTFFFNESGTVLYYGQAALSSRLRSVALSSPYDLSTMGATTTLLTLDSNLLGFSWAVARSGTRLLVSIEDDDDSSTFVREYECEPYDFASATVRSSLSIPDRAFYANYAPNGRKFFTVASNTVTQYSTVA